MVVEADQLIVVLVVLFRFFKGPSVACHAPVSHVLSPLCVRLPYRGKLDAKKMAK